MATVSVTRRSTATPPTWSSTGTGPIIPVNKDEGCFEDDSGAGITNRTDWYKLLHESGEGRFHPPGTTLNAVGQYLHPQGTRWVPWGDGTGCGAVVLPAELSILTTDGYWNDSTTNKFGMGDEDKDGHSVTLADIAMHYYQTDLRDDLGTRCCLHRTRPPGSTWSPSACRSA